MKPSCYLSIVIFSFRLCINYLVSLIILRLQNLIKSQSYATSISEIKDTTETNTKKPEKKISKAMSMYLQRAKEYGSN